MRSGKVRELRTRFVDLHREGLFVMPNAWDVGSGRILETMGFAAVATTSSGLAAALGRMDQHVTPDELVDHVAGLVAAMEIPVSVDAEHGYAASPGGVAEFFERIASVGAAGVSIEDFDPVAGILPTAAAVERVAAAAEAARRHGLVLTARAENHLYGSDDLDDTFDRLIRFRDVGADVVYAPGLEDLGQITRLVSAVGIPVNVLLRRHGPSVPALAAAGVRRVSTGGALAFAAYGALHAAAGELLSAGTSTYLDATLPPTIRTQAFTPDH
jgi:2-methylisocitrate lyase-like PEP mutase family enzyme